MDFFTQRQFTFTAALSVWNHFSKLSTEDMLVRAFIDATRNHISCKLSLASHFSTLLKQKFLRKAVLQRHAESMWLNWHCFCFVSVSMSAIIHPTWPWPTPNMGFLLALRSRARTRVLLSECPGPWAQLHRYLRFIDPGRTLNCRRWSARSVVLACPC